MARNRRRQQSGTAPLLFIAGAGLLLACLAISIQVGTAAATGLFGPDGARWPTMAQIPGIAAGLFTADDLTSAFPADIAAALPTSGWVWASLIVSCVAGVAVFVTAAALFGPRLIHRPGFAKPGEVNRLLSPAAVRRRAVQLRPDLKRQRNLPATAGGPRLCRLAGTGSPIHATVEDSVLIIGPQGSGKTAGFMNAAVADAPGSVISTSTKPDVLMDTVALRMTDGRRVHVFDPQESAHWPEALRWSPVRGCENPVTAMVRAAGFAEGAKTGKGVTNGDFWSGQTTAVLRCYLHAAAIGGLTISDVLRWSRNPRDEEPISILRERGAPAGWADELLEQGTASNNQVGSVWAGVRRAFDCLSDPRVLRACSPGPHEEFSPVDFLQGGETLYLLGTNKGQSSLAPLITAMIEDIIEVARELAAQSPGQRLPKLLTLALDEVANIAPLPSLPFVLGDGRGQGIQTLAVLQSLAQARARWGIEEADIIWDTCTCRMILPGMGNQKDAKMISDLLGQFDERVPRSIAGGKNGSRTGHDYRSRDVMAIHEIRGIRPGHCLVIYRHLDAIRGQLMFTFKRPDKARFEAAHRDAQQIVSTRQLPAGTLTAEPVATTL